MEDDSSVMLPNMIENTSAAVSSLKNRRRASRGGGSGKYQLAATAEVAAIKYIVQQAVDDRGQAVDDSSYQPSVSPDVGDGSSVRTPLLRSSHQHADPEEPVSPSVDAQSNITHITRVNVQHVNDGANTSSPRVRTGPATRRTRNQHRSATHALHTVDDESHHRAPEPQAQPLVASTQ